MHLGQASQGNLHFLCSISLRVMYVVLSFQKVHIYFVSEWLTSDLDCVLRLTYDWHQPSATPHLLLLSQPAAVLAAAAELGDCQGCCSDCYWLLLTASGCENNCSEASDIGPRAPATWTPTRAAGTWRPGDQCRARAAPFCEYRGTIYCWIEFNTQRTYSPLFPKRREALQRKKLN